MAWDTQYALEGFFLFGGPLNVTQYVIDPDDMDTILMTFAYKHHLLVLRTNTSISDM